MPGGDQMHERVAERRRSVVRGDQVRTLRREGKLGLTVVTNGAASGARSEPVDPEVFGRVRAAVLRLFADKASHHVGMREVAAATGYGMATLYRVADSKDGLLRACLSPDFEVLADRLALASRRTIGARHRFAACLSEQVSFDIENASFARIARVTTPICLWDEIDQAHRITWIFEEIFRHGQRDGSVRTDLDAGDMAISVVALTNGMLASWASNPAPEDASVARLRSAALTSLLWPAVSSD